MRLDVRSLLVWMLILLPLVVTGQDFDHTAVNPEAQEIALTDEDLPPGFQLFSAMARPGPIYDGNTLVKTLVGEFQLWRREAPWTSIEAKFFVCDTRAEASQVLRRWREGVSQAPRRREHLVGDVTYGDYERGVTAFAQDRVVVSFNVVVADPTLRPTQVTPLVDSLMQTLSDRITAGGMPPAPPFAAALQVLSSQVDPIAGSVVRAVASCNEGELEVIIDYSIYNSEHDEVFELKGQPSGVEFSWAGSSSDGTGLPAGVYKLVITAEDSLGRYDFAEEEIEIVGFTGPETLPTTKDTILRSNKPHANEGANPTLVLDRKNRETPLVGFDLAEVNLHGLTGATLVMTIPEKRRGSGGSGSGSGGSGSGPGSTIGASRITANWVEGNGRDLKSGGSGSGGRGRGSGKKGKGSGPGATWFSPIDEDISNKKPDSSVQWDGAFLASDPPTGPPVVVGKGQTGEVWLDVTQDVLYGADFGWVIRMQSKGKTDLRFYSKEGAAQAGDPDLAPRLILDFGTSASTDATTLANAGNGENRDGQRVPRVGKTLVRAPAGLLELGSLNMPDRGAVSKGVRLLGGALVAFLGRTVFPPFDLPILWTVGAFA